jgi:hypothetical protein
MGREYVDMTGQRFGRIVCAYPTKTTKSGKHWHCICDCGGTVEVLRGNLLKGTTSSCGCMQQESRIRNGLKAKVHGHAAARTSTYTSWEAMRQRCNNPNSDWYHRYGGRGVMIHPRWNDFQNFLIDMGERPYNKTLDRINPNGHYEPSNCKWATPKEQANNKVK